MSNHQMEMQKLVTQFVGQLGDLYKQAVTDALGGNGRSSNGHSNGHGKGAKRPPQELEALAEKFVKFVTGHEGLRIEQIHKELGTTTKDLALPIRKLIAEKRIKTKGQKRSTTYYAGK